MKASAYLTEALFDPKLASSGEPTETPRNVAMKDNMPCWEWFEAEGNESRRIRFGMAMEGSKQATDPKSILEGKSSICYSCLFFSHLWDLVSIIIYTFVRFRLGWLEARCSSRRCRRRHRKSSYDAGPNPRQSPLRYPRSRAYFKGCRGCKFDISSR